MQASAEDLLAQAAFRELCTPDDDPDDDFEHTYGRRVNYDKLGEAHRDSFLAAFAKAHPDKTVAQRAAEIDAERARAAIFAKGAATKEANKELSPLDTVVHKWVRKGQHCQQDNYSRKAICDAFDAGYSQAAMVRAIRRDCYSSGAKKWNGVVAGNAKCDNIKSTLKRILKKKREGKLKLDGLSHKELKSKSSEHGTRGRRVLNQTKEVSRKLSCS